MHVSVSRLSIARFGIEFQSITIDANDFGRMSCAIIVLRYTSIISRVGRSCIANDDSI